MDNYVELATALTAFQAEVVTVAKTASNPFFKSKYADLADIMQAAQPILTKHGLSVVQLPDNLDGRPALTTIVMHKSGQSVRATVPLLLTKEDPQGVGSAITYMRRYSYAAALQIVIDEDDDGNRASYQKPAQTAAVSPSRGTNPATDKQRELVNMLLDKRGIVAGKRLDYLKNMGVAVPLTMDGASYVIEQLKAPSAAKNV